MTERVREAIDFPVGNILGMVRPFFFLLFIKLLQIGSPHTVGLKIAYHLRAKG